MDDKIKDMETKNITRSLVLISIIAIVFNLARLDVWGTTNLLYLIWNLFLAWIPYLISLFFIKKETPVKYFIPIFIVWLLFFPNAPYLVTDVLHLAFRLAGACGMTAYCFSFLDGLVYF